MNRLDDSVVKVHESVKELMRNGSCDENQNQNQIIAFCLYYNESGCLETCTYAKKINSRFYQK